eukprot:Phypoly_transcript_03462.p1 GENE.Phypoly_transcript_03462~~Phypoly_transcript_03462.p1  ORF type:complete len:786 (+),score=111.21 Phypoly_transcript_03462:47-2404(+)
MGNKASKRIPVRPSYNKHAPMSSWQSDPRDVDHKATREFVNRTDTTEENVAYGEGLADVSKFNAFLDSCADMPLNDFLEAYSPEKKNAYIAQLTFDPTKSKYFNMFMDKSKRPPSDHYTPDDFALSPAQLAAFKRNGFVVTEAESSFAAAYYKIYNNDLPVLVTADSILHAFHKSYDNILQELEMNYCVPALRYIISGMREELKNSHAKFSDGPFQRSFKDVDFFLTVALYLLNSEDFCTKDSLPPILCPVEDIKRALKMCKEEQPLEVELFGKGRSIDFTQFKPRGHYAKLPALRQYFRAMTWLGTIDMIVAGEGSNLQQLGSAVLIHMLLSHNPKIEEIFDSYNRIVEVLVGPCNSMDVYQLGLLLNQIFKMKDFVSLNSEEALTKLRDQILETDLGNKKYNNGPSRSFTFLGKRFSIDSWAQSKLVTNDEAPGANVISWQNEIVHRHVTSAVEVAFSVFGNNDSAPIIHHRIAQTNASNKFRDGLIYHPYLVAARNTIDDLPQQIWTSSIYMFWLAALRKLSEPLDPKFPQAMRTQAYAMKKLSTQLGSWAQLRHDNLLYVDQMCRYMASCDYPEGFVEPHVKFWEAMESLCMASAKIVTKIGEETSKLRTPEDPLSSERRFNFFHRFARHMRVLRDISVKELHQEPLDADQTVFLKTIVEKQEVGSGGEIQWTGWYPALFFGGSDDAEESDTIVCDVFTNPPSDNDPGCVVHQGLGKPRRMIMAVDNGKSLTAYAGPVYDYYEFELPDLQRMSDEEWSEKITTGKDIPQPPEWTSSFLVSS